MVGQAEKWAEASGKPREIRQTPDQGQPNRSAGAFTSRLIGFAQCERGLAPGTLLVKCRYNWCAAPERSQALHPADMGRRISTNRSV